jgi:DNA-binding transcriptional ArsR family regulator
MNSALKAAIYVSVFSLALWIHPIYCLIMRVHPTLLTIPVEGRDTPSSLAEFGTMIGDPVRAAILLELSDGTTRPAGELATLAGASPQAASAHLAQLVAGGLLTVVKQGRHRFFCLASGEVAEIIENLSFWTIPPSRRPRHDPTLCRARLCYDHLAGRLGVTLLERLTERRLLELGPHGLGLSEAGREWLERLTESSFKPAGGRPLVRLCLDWTERRNHLGGQLGAKLAGLMLERGYVARGAKHRSLLVTTAGARFLHGELGIEIER